MYLLGVLCLVSFTAALPFSEPHVEDVAPKDPAADTAAPALETDAQKGEHEEKNDKDESGPSAEFTTTLPHPIKPQHHEVIIKLYKVDRYTESEDPEDKVISRHILGPRISLTPALTGLTTAIGNLVTIGLPQFIAALEKLPLLDMILARSFPSRIAVIEEVQSKKDYRR